MASALEEYLAAQVSLRATAAKTRRCSTTFGDIRKNNYQYACAACSVCYAIRTAVRWTELDRLDLLVSEAWTPIVEMLNPSTN